MHSTDNLDDGYLGSGKYLRRSLNKHGIENHNKEIIEFLTNRNSLKERERQIVNEELVHDKLCMNLKLGGEGGWPILNIKIRKKISSLGGKAKIKLYGDMFHNHHEKLKNDLIYRLKYLECMKDVNQGKEHPFYNKHHTEETKLKMSLSQQGKQKGERNSQYGTCWITNNKENKKIKKEDINIYTKCGWVLGRKVK
jgi:hypothetical protein